jgi:hypothetical protein
MDPEQVGRGYFPALDARDLARIVFVQSGLYAR